MSPKDILHCLGGASSKATIREYTSTTKQKVNVVDMAYDLKIKTMPFVAGAINAFSMMSDKTRDAKDDIKSRAKLAINKAKPGAHRSATPVSVGNITEGSNINVGSGQGDASAPDDFIAAKYDHTCKALIFCKPTSEVYCSDRRPKRTTHNLAVRGDAERIKLRKLYAKGEQVFDRIQCLHKIEIRQYETALATLSVSYVALRNSIPPLLEQRDILARKLHKAENANQSWQQYSQSQDVKYNSLASQYSVLWSNHETLMDGYQTLTQELERQEADAESQKAIAFELAGDLCLERHQTQSLKQTVKEQQEEIQEMEDQLKAIIAAISSPSNSSNSDHSRLVSGSTTNIALSETELAQVKPTKEQNSDSPKRVKPNIERDDESSRTTVFNFNTHLTNPSLQSDVSDNISEPTLGFNFGPPVDFFSSQINVGKLGPALSFGTEAINPCLRADATVDATESTPVFNFGPPVDFSSSQVEVDRQGTVFNFATPIRPTATNARIDSDIMKVSSTFTPSTAVHFGVAETKVEDSIHTPLTEIDQNRPSKSIRRKAVEARVVGGVRRTQRMRAQKSA